MPTNSGRKLVIRRGGTVIAGIQAKSISMNGEAIDVSGDDENGWRTLLSEPGQRSFDLSFDGVTKDPTLRELIITGTTLLLTDVTVTFPEGDVFASDFFFSNLENTGSYNEAVKFSGSMQSSGEPTYTPAV